MIREIMKFFNPGSLMQEKNHPKSKWKFMNLPEGAVWLRRQISSYLIEFVVIVM
jgi:hypothetical protein